MQAFNLANRTVLVNRMLLSAQHTRMFSAKFREEADTFGPI